MVLPDVVNRQFIGLDYDNTFTEDPVLWKSFVQLATSRGHTVFITTARGHDDVKDIMANLPGVEIITSDGGSKMRAAYEYGVGIDIWIDDMPQIIPESWQSPHTHS